MNNDPDDLGDAKSREEDRTSRATFERKRTGLASPEIVFSHRWVPLGNRRISMGDLILMLVGAAILLAVLGMHILGYY